jgi:hypothetical protein
VPAAASRVQPSVRRPRATRTSTTTHASRNSHSRRFRPLWIRSSPFCRPLWTQPPVAPVRGRVGGEDCRLDWLYADRSYDHDEYRRLIHAKGVKHRIGRRGVENGAGLGKHRHIVERTIALLHWCRLRIRWEIRDDIREAFLRLGAALSRRRRRTR